MDTNDAKRPTAQAPGLLAALKADAAVFETMRDYCLDRAWALHAEQHLGRISGLLWRDDNPLRVPELIDTLLDDKRTFDAMLNSFSDGPWRLHAEKSVERIDAVIGSDPEGSAGGVRE